MPVVSNIPTRPAGEPWTNSQCVIAIGGLGFLSGGVQIIEHSKVPTNGTDGTATATLPYNNPGEIYYWTNPGPEAQPIPFQMLSSMGAGPFTLDQLHVTQTVAAGVIAVTQDALAAAVVAWKAYGDSTYVSRSSTQIGIDTDSVPYFSAALPFTDAVPVLTDTDGVPYFEVV